MTIQEHPGYYGVFTREQADGALPSGARVRKINSEPDDKTKTGTHGTVLGSYGEDGIIIYFVEWDTSPKSAIATAWLKVEEVNEPTASVD